MEDGKMSLKNKIIILVIAIILAAAVFSMVSADTNSLLEFFGFGKPTQTITPTPTAESGSQPKSQKTPAPDADPFSGYDPALVETDEQEVTSKNSDSWFSDDLENDPFAYSFSENRFQEDPSANQQKAPDGSYPSNRARRDPTPTPRYQYYWIDNNPVFRPMCVLPRTGFPTKMTLAVKENVSYAPTNMSLVIPGQNINEEIVIVPLVDDNFPVENLGHNIGLLEGSGPSENDLFVLAGHNHLNSEEKGPFATLSAMKISDLIFVRGAAGATRTFVVYANEKFAEDDIDGLLSYARPGCMILITCEDESIEGGYLNRRVVFAEAKED